MDSSFNKEAIKEYSKKYSEKIINVFFEYKTDISGEEVLKLTEVKQVNLFVLKLLFEAWYDEMEKIKSPYFDNNHQEVQEALIKYKNAISRHILVNKIDFEPLLQQAVYEALLIIVSPYHYYDEELKKFGDKINLQAVKNTEKFTKVNKPILQAIINKMELDTNQFSNSSDLLDAVLEETDLIPDDSTSHIDNFNKILQLDFNIIYSNNSDEVEEEINNDTASAQEIEKNEIEESDANKSSFVTLNDTFSSGEVETLADIHEKQSIEKIETSITLNQRFMFVNGLFDGDVDSFNETIKRLDTMNNYGEAENYIVSHFNNWDKEDEDVIEFFDIVRKRYV
ncbi:MAG: hypothetical protein OEW67_06225 [Cyclobacteriaceae bacterium]|nr:hypothetical protein [Cyclobacteriaceae bacterium]